MGNANAKSDMERYRNGYPGQEDDPNANQNYLFYCNEIPSRPRGDYVEEIHKNWFYDYDLLEEHHGYIQWLFPIREHGMNWDSQMLQKHEIEKIKANPDCIRRFLRSYDLMLNFYGCKVLDPETGKLGRTADWKSRYRNLETHYHNYLRITRILKCLGELGFEHFKRPFLEHFIDEIWVNKELRAPAESCRKYWVETLRDDVERDTLIKKIEALTPPPVSEIRPTPSGRWILPTDGGDDDSDDDGPSIATRSPEEIERERQRFRAMIAAQNAANAGSDDDDDGNDDDEDDENDSEDEDNTAVPEKYRKWIQAEISGDDSDEESEEEGDAGAGAGASDENKDGQEQKDGEEMKDNEEAKPSE